MPIPRPWKPRAACLRALFGLALVGLVSCAKEPMPTLQGPALHRVPAPQGLASWYGYPHHGRTTASGHLFNMHQLTAAHRTLPLGARVRVTNLTNRRMIVVTITHRGPFVDGRILDLSYAAAKQIRLIGQGTAPVRLEVLR